MLLRLLAALSLVASVSAAQAEEGSSSPSNGTASAYVPGENGSEFMYQSEAGKFELTPSLLYSDVQVNYNDTYSGHKNLKTESRSLPVGIGAEYGINQMWSVGLAITNQSTHNSVSCDDANCGTVGQSKGFTNPALSIKGRTHAGRGVFRFGVEWDISMAKAKTDASGDSNADTGGQTITPFVGYETPLGPGFLGFKLTYDAYKGDRKGTDDTAGGDFTTSGGQQLNMSAFYEANIGRMTYGGALVYTTAAESKTAVGSAAATGNKDAATAISLQAYIPAHLTSDITILPVVSYTAGSYTQSQSKYDTVGMVAIGVAGRFTF